MGPIALALLGAALAGGGRMIQNRQANQYANDVAGARNRVLQETLQRNDPIAANSRAAFDERITAGAPTPAAEQAAVDNRQATMTRAVAPPVDMPTTGHGAPTVVNSTIANAMQRATDDATAEATALGRVGAYGDLWFNQGQANQGLANDLRTDANFAGGNLTLLPHLQDLAELQVRRKPGILADIMVGAGNALGSFAGTRGRPTPPTTLPTVGTGYLY